MSFITQALFIWDRIDFSDREKSIKSMRDNTGKIHLKVIVKSRTYNIKKNPMLSKFKVIWFYLEIAVKSKVNTIYSVKNSSCLIKYTQNVIKVKETGWTRKYIQQKEKHQVSKATMLEISCSVFSGDVMENLKI